MADTPASTLRRVTHTKRGRLLIAATAAVLAIGALTALVVASGSDNDDTTGGQVTANEADPAPATPFELLDGGRGSFADYDGRPLVVNFFASWCVPCLAEMPGFEQVHQDLDGQVAFLGINLQDTPEDGRGVVEQTGITYDVARDPDGTLFAAFGGFAMPTTVLIDANGQVVDVHSGEISAVELADMIDTVLLG